MFGFGSGFNDYNRGHETTPNPPIPGKRSLSDILMILGAGLKDSSSPEGNNLGMVQQQMAQRQKQAQQQALLAELMPQLTGGGGVQGGQGPSDDVLRRAALAGVPGVAEMISLRGQNKPTYERGVRVNPYDANAPAYIPDLDKGQAPQFGPGGQIAGVGNLPGSVKSMAEMEMAKANAQEAAKSMYVGQNAFNQSRGGAMGSAPYEFVNVPTPMGAPRVMSKDAAAGGVFTGQSPADAIRANTAATGEAGRAQALQDRAATAGRQLSALDTMEGLLPDVIAGFGADFQLQAARALAAAGNEDAVRKVKATETFLNQGRVLVSDIIKTFGANPTEGERKYAERMSGADAQLNPETLKEGIRLQRSRINRDLQAAGKATQAGAPPRDAVAAELRRRGLIR